MNPIAVIPARYQSSRFPGKPLAEILGQTMIQRVYERVRQARCISDILVATDDKRIAAEVDRFGGRSVMTSDACASGSDRVFEAVRGIHADAIINIQGDEPLVDPKLIDKICNRLNDQPNGVVTAVYWNESFADFQSPHIVKTVMNRHRQAIYFSRSPIPAVAESLFTGFFQHIGMYGYSPAVLNRFVSLPPGALETSEQLEQLRFLEDGTPIHLVIADQPSHAVDIPDDIFKIEKLLRSK